MNNKGDEVSIDFKSKFLGDAEFMKANLGHALCLAKWKQVSLHLPTGLNNSCYHPPLHPIPAELLEDNPGALHNTPHKKEQRKIMLRQERPSECSYCWAMEDNNKLSDRHYRSGEPWAAKDFDVIVNSNGDEDVIPSYVEVNFNHACNLACSYCSPQFSSTWQQEVTKWGGYPTTTIHNDPSHFVGRNRPIPNSQPNPYVDAFWSWWPTLYPELKHFRMTGGEPLMSAETWKLIEWFKTNKGKSQTRLAINSNLGTDVDIDRLLAAIDGVEVDLYTSNESMSLQAEYIRDGLVWDDWANNVERLLDSGKFRGIHVMCTINALCLISLPEFLWMIVKLKQKYGKDSINFSLNILRFPSFQSPLILPLEMRVEFAHELGRFGNAAREYLHEFEFNQLDRLIEYLNNVDSPHSGALSREVLQRDFKNFYEQYDQRRGKDFRHTFPQLTEWYDTL